MRVEIGIITCNRYTHLAGLLSSVISQDYENWDLTIVDDSPNPLDLRSNTMLNGLLKLVEEKGHKWRVFFGPHKGSHFCHQIVLDTSRHPLTFRCDDDHFLDRHFLSHLVSFHPDEKIGATGGIVLLPKDKGRIYLPKDWEKRENYTEKIHIKANGSIGFGNNLQYVLHGELSEPKYVQHLIGAMVYKTDVARRWGYNLDLSYTSMCEDDDFSYQFYVNGWKLLVIPQAIYWHFPEKSHGRIMKGSKEYVELAKSDRVMFENRVRKWNNWKPGMII